MNRAGMYGWQLILADLALILFLLTLSALANEEAEKERREGAQEGMPRDPQMSPSQALFRPDPLGPTLAEWLEQRPHDPRATLTVFAQYAKDDRASVWERANSLAANATDRGFAVRVVITRGSRSDLYASLGYDAPVADR